MSETDAPPYFDVKKAHDLLVATITIEIPFEEIDDDNYWKHVSAFMRQEAERQRKIVGETHFRFQPPQFSRQNITLPT